MSKTSKKIISTSELKAIKLDRMINFNEMARRMGERPERVRAYTYTRGRGSNNFALHPDLNGRCREVLREHAIFILTLTGDITPPKLPGQEPNLEGIK